MKRKAILLTALVEKLCMEIDNISEIFIAERPFLLNRNIEPVITELPEKRKKIDVKMQAIIKELKKIL